MKCTNSRSYSRHFFEAHSPPIINAATYRRLINQCSAIKSTIVFAIKQQLINRVKLKIRIVVPCAEQLYLSIFYPIDATLYRYRYFPVSQTHTHIFEAVNGKTADDILDAVTLVLSLPNDDWCRRYHVPWRGGYAGASYVDIQPQNKKRSMIVFRSIIKKIKEPTGPDSQFTIHQNRFLFMTMPTSLC
jgi:hypothetical protein